MAKKNNSATNGAQTTIAFPGADEEHLDIAALETWLWDAACVIRGTTDAPKFKDFILPLIFFKRFSDVFDDEFDDRLEALIETISRHRLSLKNTEPGHSGACL